MDERWRIELGGKLWVCALVDSASAGDAEFHFGHAPIGSESSTVLEWTYCPDAGSVSLMRWLLSVMKDAVTIARRQGVNDLYFAVFNEDGRGEERNVAVNRLLAKLPESLWEWAEDHVFVGY